MIRQKIFFLILIAIIFVVNYLYGNSICYLLSVTFIGCCAYYLLHLQTENNIEIKASKINANDINAKINLLNFSNQRVSLYSLILLTIVFITTIISIKKILNPTNNHPWYFNNEHYGIANTGISFANSLDFQYAEPDSIKNLGNIHITKNKDKILVNTNQLYTPIFLKNENNYSILNNIYKAKINNQFVLKNATTSISITILPAQKSILDLFKKDKIQYTINLKCNDVDLLNELNLPNNYSDEIVVIEDELEKGKSLYNLFIGSKNITSKKTETLQLFEQLLGQISETYLLVNYDANGTKSLCLFPDRNCIANEYSLFVDAKQYLSSNQFTFEIPYNTSFYFGFNHTNENMYFTNTSNKTSLIYDFPKTYLLGNPSKENIGDKHIRFITTNYDNVIDNTLTEGFYFNHPQLQNNYIANAQLEFESQLPKNILSASIVDYNSNGKSNNVSKDFVLKTQVPGIEYLFELKDFSNNGFSYQHILKYSIYLYLLFCVIVIFFRGNKLDRIEPIIWAVIYSLLVVRFIMYWRIATFPPLHNISKYEFENTLQQFDFNLLGFKTNFPITLLFTTLVVIALIIYRLAFKIKNLKNENSFLYKLLLKYENRKIVTNKNFIKMYASILIVLLVAHFTIHIEFLLRFINIICPLILYIYFSIKANTFYLPSKPTLNLSENKYIKYTRVFLHYILFNPTFLITIFTIFYFSIADRGFSILFILFILLKNVLLNFSKSTFIASNNKFLDMFIKPWNYWIYAVFGLIIYLFVLGFKSLFYYLLVYKLWLFFILLLFVCLIVKLFYSNIKYLLKGTYIITAIYFLVLIIPYTNNGLDKFLTDKIKHVQYRASLIHQPINTLLVNNAYNSFNTNKIIATAENQWFINSYISKPYDNNFEFNLRPFSKVGVNYNTQTRDVVVARFIISELGKLTMILLLSLLALPMIIYLLSYKLKLNSNSNTFNIPSYAGLIPLLIIFTLSLFVWLTATNRFVFFGQDFPFLSLTSKVSVLLPLLLYSITLLQAPQRFNVTKLNLQLGLSRYLILIAAIVIVGLTTIKSNDLKTENFSVVVKEAKENIEGPFNQILSSVQDSLYYNHIKFTYSGLIGQVVKNKNYQIFKKRKSKR